MKIEEGIRQKLTETFRPMFMELVNESHRHHRPKGSETHFKLLMVTSNFEGKARLARQQSVYELLKLEMAGPVHALTMKLYSPAEWEALPLENRSFRALGHHPAGKVDDE